MSPITHLGQGPHIEIITPAAAGSLHGNRITAQRWSLLLRKLHYAVDISQTGSGLPVACVIALHAQRSHAAIAKSKTLYPEIPVILIMTGTDLYRDLGHFPEVDQSMALADAIVVLQDKALALIPPAFQEKTVVIYQSVKGITRKPLPKKHFLVCVIGHLRPEKDPFRLAHAIEHYPDDAKLKVIHLGQAMSSSMQEQALYFNKSLPRYHWLGELSHAQTMQYLSRSHVMVISSEMEGGAHVVSEAIAIGVPVIASAIPGNQGLLGDGYSGYFPVGDENALRQMLLKAEFDLDFYHTLEHEIQLRQQLISPQREMQSIDQLMKKVLKSH